MSTNNKDWIFSVLFFNHSLIRNYSIFKGDDEFLTKSSPDGDLIVHDFCTWYAYIELICWLWAVSHRLSLSLSLSLKLKPWKILHCLNCLNCGKIEKTINFEFDIQIHYILVAKDEKSTGISWKCMIIELKINKSGIFYNN